ncbi:MULTISPECIES: QueT transporter family protein [unclassified Halanaerobium]|uniref:QueT transporter family protein n=1 Tax=unclassified Halanaerobium TaxID=2641197 RepID=UPI000DF3E734|nr:MULTISPECIES: QueT transporter family protein [unclassified Halanaerobium]RCW41697.1 energy-coupling factor transport system substrate-specific component [Halanaerobium sp. MA284_MarDTE_T2]RCW79482.1 energy-coupling factor transport system substrate-specific component [Halanaerobium sp. DL-01]
MKEVFSMWKSTKMVVLVALCAGLYAALLIPFKSIVLIPGITEVRPASALPVVMGLLFGPAGAWGSAIGNLIGDFFGSLGIGSIFGFVGNFMFAYIPYKVWDNMGLVNKNDREPDLKSGRKIWTFIVAALGGALGCALIIGWGLELLGMVPFAALGAIITLNNSIPSIVLGIPLLIVLYPRIKKWDLMWTDILPPEDMPKTGAAARMGSIIMYLGVMFGLLGGLAVAAGAAGQELFSFTGQAGEGTSVILVAGIGVAATFIGSFMQ